MRSSSIDPGETMTQPDYNPYAAPAETSDRDFDAHPSPETQLLATPGQRFAGNLIDTIVLIVPGVFAYLPIIELEAVAESSPDFDTKAWIMMGVSGLVVLAIGLTQCVMISNTGQSIGKRLVKTKVVRLDGSNPGFFYGVFMRGFVGRLGGFIPVIGNLYNLVDALYVFRADRRTIRDQIAGTRVIQV
jgi:uncharacterized RDD family membrane protein YckC